MDRDGFYKIDTFISVHKEDSNEVTESPLTKYGVTTPRSEDHEVILVDNKFLYASNGGRWSPFPLSRWHRSVIEHFRLSPQGAKITFIQGNSEVVVA